MGWNIWNEKTTCGPFNQTLKVNEACLRIVSNLNKSLELYMQNTECYECNYVGQGRTVSPNSITSYVINTKFGYNYYFSDGKNITCKKEDYFEDFGIYSINVTQDGCSNLEILKEPEKLWLNIGLLIVLYSGLIASFYLLTYIYSKGYLYFSSMSLSLRELEMDLGSPNYKLERSYPSRRQARVASIDAFRGVTILLMIFVNYNGGDYSAFQHSPWNGLSIADLVFPWFVWIMGASIPLSLRSNLRISRSRATIFGRILKRSVLLIALGIMVNSGHRNKGYLRIPGVLQRLGVTYFVVAFVEMIIAKSQRNEHYGPWHYCQDIIDSWIQWLLAICITVVHVTLTFWLSIPGCPTGYLGAGGLSEHSLYRNCTGGSAGYIDRLIITDKHMYHGGSFVKIFAPPVPYDPEGLLGTLTSILCAFFGVQASRIILSYENSHSRIQKWLIWAIITGLSAGFLCNWSQNDGIIPVNKNLWSLSYVLASSSIAFFILTLFYWLIDYAQYWRGFPFIYPGMNAIVLYLGHSFLKSQLPWRWIPFTNTHFELLIMDTTAAVIWLIISYVLHKYNIFITL